MAPTTYTHPTGESVMEYNILSGYTYRLGYVYPLIAKPVMDKTSEIYDEAIGYWIELNNSLRFCHFGIACDSLIIDGNRVSTLNDYYKYKTPLLTMVKWFDSDTVANHKKIHHIAMIMKAYLLKDLCEITEAIEKTSNDECKAAAASGRGNDDDWMYLCNTQWDLQTTRKQLVEQFVGLKLILKFIEDIHGFSTAKVVLAEKTKLPEAVIRHDILTMIYA
jgi:hypothetical protein